MLGYFGCVLIVEVFFCECAVLTSNFRIGYKLEFNTMFANYYESSFTYDAAVYLVFNIHYGASSPHIRVVCVTFFCYKNYLTLILFVKVRLATP